jgi:3-hydroxyacyl-[acyl-carrier-protein] dehydratase
MYDIEKLIPHRPPFLLLDEIESIEENRILARVTVRPEGELFREVFKGHYPGNPLTPGVLLCEMVFQAGAALLSHRLGERAEGVPVLARITKARFRERIDPGDSLLIESVFVEQVASAYFLKGSVQKDGKTAVQVEYTCVLVPGQRH